MAYRAIWVPGVDREMWHLRRKQWRSEIGWFVAQRDTHCQIPIDVNMATTSIPEGELCTKCRAEWARRFMRSAT